MENIYNGCRTNAPAEASYDLAYLVFLPEFFYFSFLISIYSMANKLLAQWIHYFSINR